MSTLKYNQMTDSFWKKWLLVTNEIKSNSDKKVVVNQNKPKFITFMGNGVGEGYLKTSSGVTYLGKGKEKRYV